MNTLLAKSTLAAAIALTIVACAPEGGSVAGIGGSGYVSSGSVTGFGSVFVNGVEFETNRSTFDVDGNLDGTQNDLAIGMIVQVSGTINDDGVTGNATNIRYDDEIQGPVEGPIKYDLDRLTASFTVLGVNVIIDSGSTSFDIDDDLPANTVFGFDDSLNNNVFADGNNIEVSGFFDSSGNLKATRIELKDIIFDTNSVIEIKGTISALSGNTFSLGSLSVDTSSATLDDLPNGLQDGLFVEVKGTLDASRTTLTASEVDAEDNSLDDTDEFEIEGIITDYISDSSFKVNSIPVDASSASREPSSLILSNDTRIEVEGAIINGTLVASEIESEGGDIKVHAKVTEVNAAAGTFKISPVTGQEITVTITTGTQLEDDVSEIEPFTLNNLVVNDFVEVRGFDNGNGGITAIEIDVKEPDKVVVQGIATAATGDSSNGTITVFGITFSFDATTDFEDINDIDMDNTKINALISAIQAAPQLVKIEDKQSGAGGNAVGIADEIDTEAP